MQEVGNIQQQACKNRMKLNRSKTSEMLLRGRTTKQVPDALPSIVMKPALKLLGVTFNQDPCNWDTHFDLLQCKASSWLYIIRVCKFYGHLQEGLMALFKGLRQSKFGRAHQNVNTLAKLISSVNMSTNIVIYGILHPLKIFFMPEIICYGIRSPKTVIIVYVTYFPCRGEGHSILTAVTTFYLIFV